MSEHDEPRPPYEEVLDEPPPVVDAPGSVPMTKPVRPMHLPGRPKVELIPDAPQTWTEARIMRLGAIVVATVLVLLFIVTASRVLAYYAWWLSWAPFLVGALPYLAYAAMASRKHLEDESRSRERRENVALSQFDFTPIADQGKNTERWP